jgi:hypothetical protein
MEELLVTVFSVLSVSELYNESALSRQLSSARELAAEGSTSWSHQSKYEVGVRWSQAYEDVSPEAEELPPLEAVTEQRD